MDARMQSLLRRQLLNASAYPVPDSRGLIKLDAMENPYHLPEDLRAAWLASLAGAELNRYPDPRAHDLSALLREQLRLAPGIGLLLGNGSDELIQLLGIAVAGNGRPVLAPVPTFVMYGILAEALGMDFVGVPLRGDFTLDPDALLAAVRRHDPALVYLAYPNNPTGNLFDDAAIHAVLRASSGLVVVDEAYSAFSSRSFIEHLGIHDNLLVMRTLSKQGLAGLRLGFLMGPKPWIEQLDKLRLPYNVNVLTQVSAAFLLRHAEALERQVQSIRQERGRLYAALSRLPGLTPFPSEANFILFRTPAGRATEIFQGLREGGILIKNLSGTSGLADCLRVTVGTPDENTAFLHVLETLL